MFKNIKKSIAVFLGAVLTLNTVLAVPMTAKAEVTSVDTVDVRETTESTDYEIYPTPHSVVYSGTTTVLEDTTNVVYEEGIDKYTKNHLDDVLDIQNINGVISTAVSSSTQDILVGIYQSGGVVDQYFQDNNLISSADLFAKNDAYILSVKDGVIAVLGKDTDAAYYGITSLKHVFYQVQNKTVRNFIIEDYSDIPARGFIEGYYGSPWSNEDRAQLMKFGSEIKMNQYLFAPKDDPYHNSKWRIPYPQEELDGIRELAEVGNETKNYYVWTIHPFMKSAFNFNQYENDFGIITTKFTQLLEVGVRQFGVLADDASSTTAANTNRLINDLTDWLIEQKATYPDLRTEILYCPADYHGSGNSDFLRELNAGVVDSVKIMQTGGAIWGSVSKNFGTNFSNYITTDAKPGRKPYIWMNWPCTDNSKNSLVMGGYTNVLHVEVDGSTYEGLVVNPMQYSEPSKVAIFGAAEYGWNIWETQDQADQAWDASFRYIEGESAETTAASDALKEISKHMINHQAAGAPRFQESVEIASALSAFKEAASAGTATAEAGNALIAEFQKIYSAAQVYSIEGRPAMVKHITPWLNALMDISAANMELITAVINMVEGNDSVMWTHYAEGQKLYEQSRTHTFLYKDYYETAEAGHQHIVPFTKSLLSTLAIAVGSVVDPSKVITTYFTNRTDSPEGNVANITDGSIETQSVYKSPNSIAVGEYVGLRFTQAIHITDITFELGAISNPNDTFSKAVLEYSVDGKEWIRIGNEYTAPKSVVVEELDIQAKAVRMIATEAKTNTWLGVKEITVNKNDVPVEEEKGTQYTGTVIKSSTWTVSQGSEANLQDGSDSSLVWYKTGADDSAKVDDFIGLDLGETREIGKVHIVNGGSSSNGDKLQEFALQYSTDNSTWTTFKAYTMGATGIDTIDEDLGGVEARYIRILNQKTTGKWAQFSAFEVYASLGFPYVYTNVESLKSLTGQHSSSEASLDAKTGITLAPQEYVGIKLERIKEVAECNANPVASLTLQISTNGVEWVGVDDTLKNVRYMRYINETSEPVTFDLTTFSIQSRELTGPQFVSTTMGIHSAYGTSDSRNTNKLHQLFDGNLGTKVEFCDYPRQDGNIIYNLGVTRNISKLRVYIKDTENNYLRDAKIQISSDSETWTDVITLGDGVQNTADVDQCTSEGWTHDSDQPGNAYIEGSLANPQAANYIRVLMTAPYGRRFVSINEIIINDGEYVKTTTDPTFECDPIEKEFFGPENMVDGDLLTAFVPDMTKAGNDGGSLIYRISEVTDVKQINVVQSPGNNSNAALSIRTAGSTIWTNIGNLSGSLMAFDVENYANIVEVKLTWANDVSPSILEMVFATEKSAMGGGEVEPVQLEVPAYFAASNITASSFTLNWTPVLSSNDSVSYCIKTDLMGGPWVEETSDTKLTLSNLQPDTDYMISFYVKGTNNSSSDVTMITVRTLPLEAPSIPKRLSTAIVTNESAVLRWTESTDRVGIKEYVIMNSHGEIVGRTEFTHFEVSGLNPDTEYQFTVKAVNNNDVESEASDTVRVLTLGGTDAEKPSAPTNVTASAITQTSATLSWTASTDNVGVVRYLVKTTGGDEITETTSTSVAISGLIANTAYSYVVVAQDAAGNQSEASATVTFTTLEASAEADTEKPSAPTNVTASGITQTSATLTWTASTDNVGVVKYIVKTLSGGVVTETTGTTASISRLTPNTAYSYVVVAQDAAGNQSEASATVTFTTLEASAEADTEKPSAPTNVTASGITQTSATLTWTASTDNVGVVRYLVKTTGGDEITETTGTTASISGLTANTAYSYVVVAQDAAGNQSEASATVTFTTLEASAEADTEKPSAPTNVTASGITQTSATLTWTASTDNVGVVKYIINTLSGGAVTETTGTTASISGLTANTAYSYVVVAQDAAGNQSEASQSVEFTTLASEGGNPPPIFIPTPVTPETPETPVEVEETETAVVGTAVIEANGTLDQEKVSAIIAAVSKEAQKTGKIGQLLLPMGDTSSLMIPKEIVLDASNSNVTIVINLNQRAVTLHIGLNQEVLANAVWEGLKVNQEGVQNSDLKPKYQHTVLPNGSFQIKALTGNQETNLEAGVRKNITLIYDLSRLTKKQMKLANVTRFTKDGKLIAVKSELDLENQTLTSVLPKTGQVAVVLDNKAKITLSKTTINSRNNSRGIVKLSGSILLTPSDLKISSMNKKVATVNNKGAIIPVKAGKANIKIIATSANGVKNTYKLSITVK